MTKYVTVTPNSKFVREGDNVTITLKRTGDLSERLDFLVSTVYNGSYSENLQMGYTGEQENLKNKLVTLDAGQASTSFSYATYRDGLAENPEISFASIYAVQWFGDDRYFWDHSVVLSDNVPGTLVYDENAIIPQTQPEPTPVVIKPPTPFVWNSPASEPKVPHVSINIDNSVTNNYTDNSVRTNYINSFNTDNSINTYTLSYVLESNDYSVGKTTNGSGLLRGSEDNDLITGGNKNDKIYGESGNDELVGRSGKDQLYGGLGSNVFDAGTSSSRRDSDRLFVVRENDSSSADIIEAIGRSDRIYIQGSTGNLDVRGIEGGLGIFDNDVLQAIYTGNNFSSSALNNMLVSA